MISSSSHYHLDTGIHTAIQLPIVLQPKYCMPLPVPLHGPLNSVHVAWKWQDRLSFQIHAFIFHRVLLSALNFPFMRLVPFQDKNMLIEIDTLYWSRYYCLC